MDDLLDDESRTLPTWTTDVEDLIEAIRTGDTGPDWQRGIELDLGAKKWRPPAVSSDQSQLLYVSLQTEMPRFVVSRLKLAAAQDIQITIAVTIAALFSEEFLGVLLDIEPQVYVVDDYREDQRFRRRHLLAALADIEVPVQPSLRRDIAESVWARIDAGTVHEKGRRLEALLSFIFSQVSDLKVAERNYRNKSEEIDIVLQVDNLSRRVWHKSGVPFILVESKNIRDKASQQMMSVMLAKIQTKRGSARIGIMVSPNGFTEDAKIQELRYSTQEICVVMIDGGELRSLFDADDLDEALEVIVRRSFLR